MELPKVSIIVTTYKESSKQYLDLCIESIKNLNYDHTKLEVLIVTRKAYVPQYEGVQTIFPEEEAFYPARAINFAMQAASKDSKYFFILNDDAVCTKNCLFNLVMNIGDQKLMANVISPCENGQHYHLAFGFTRPDGSFEHVREKQYRIEDYSNYLKEMMNAESLYTAPGFIWMNYLCIFATLIPRSLYEAIGDWDENFKCGQDDLDYSWRAQKAGYQTVAVINALAWHFSGVTAEGTLNLKIRQENVKYFREKWKVLPPGIPESFLDL